MANWYANYDTSTNDVKGAGFYSDPAAVTANLPAGEALTSAQTGDIPNDLMDQSTGDSNYTTDGTTVTHK